jgi:hypothetical protein
MYRILKLVLLSVFTVLVVAAVSLWAEDLSPIPTLGWKEKPLRQWNEEDAKQVLADSPWVKYATPGQVRDLSLFERRDGGDWDADIGSGVGVFGTGIFGPRKAAAAIAHAHAKAPAGAVMIRWESALPVRTAEQKTGETEVPSLDSDDYAIAVYDMPFHDRWNIARELRGIAFIKRDKKKDIRPSRVQILRHADDTATIVYLFPRSVEIAKKDGRLEFVAQVGSLVVSQYFYTDQMQVRSELQLLMPSNELR